MSTYCWDHEDCPREGCEGDLQQQDQFNVMCLECEHVWTHVRSETKHTLQTADFETVAEKPVAMADGGQSAGDTDQKITSQIWPQLSHSNVVCNPSSITSRPITSHGEDRHSGQGTSIVVLERFPTEVRRTLWYIGQFCSLQPDTDRSNDGESA